MTTLRLWPVKGTKLYAVTDDVDLIYNLRPLALWNYGTVTSVFGIEISNDIVESLEHSPFVRFDFSADVIPGVRHVLSKDARRRVRAIIRWVTAISDFRGADCTIIEDFARRAKTSIDWLVTERVFCEDRDEEDKPF